MKSGHIVDTSSRVRQLTQFFRDRGRERNRTMQTEAQEKEDKFLALIQAGNANPGRILSHSEIGRRLKKLNPSLILLQSIAYPDQGGIYIRDERSNLDDLNLAYRGLRFVGALGWGMVPENTCGVIQTDEKGDFKGRITKKGWRLTLCNLISARLITVSGAERLFGSGGKGWHERLH